MQIVIDTNNNGKTIRNFLRGELGFSSAMLKKLKFSENGILVNGEFRTARLMFPHILSRLISR